MRIDCIGAGPGGLLLAILVKAARQDARVRVFERSAPGKATGFGIVLDDEVQQLLLEAFPAVGLRVSAALLRSHTIGLDYGGAQLVSDGHSIGTMSRTLLLEILQDTARQLGVELHYGRAVEAVNDLDADVVVASDGAASAVREQFRDAFQPSVRWGENWYLWCSTPRAISGIRFGFRRGYGGWVWNQAYQYDRGHSTIILECDQAARAGLLRSRTSEAESTRASAELFGATLAPESLAWVAPGRGASAWRQFMFVSCARWHCANVVLLGDAAHTTHYSIGAGTKNAFGDAIALQRHLLAQSGTLEARLTAYTAERVSKLREAQWLSDNSNRWFEQRTAWDELSPEQFACALLSRTKQHAAPFTAAQLERMSVLARRQLCSTKPHRVGAFALRPWLAEKDGSSG